MAFMQNFWTLWIYILIDIIAIVGFIVWWLWKEIFDTRTTFITFYPNKQMKLYKTYPKNDVVTCYDKNTDSNKTYTINKKFMYFKDGRKPYAYYWDNIPIPLSLTQNQNFSKEEINVIKKLNTRIPEQINIEMPNKELKKDIEIDTAETFFSVLHTNFTLNLLQKPKDYQKAVKWTIILIVIGIVVLLILHFAGVINIFDLLGVKPPVKK